MQDADRAEACNGAGTPRQDRFYCVGILNGVNMNRHLRKGLCALSLAAAALSSATVHAAPYANLVLFGDSLSDTGNNAAIFDALAGGARTAVPLGPGDDPVPTLPYSSDRYSNGPVWAEYFASALGLDATASLLGGTNFSFGGARVTSHPLAPYALSLQGQVSAYLGTTGGIAAADNLYVVAGGSNDIRDVIDLALGGGDPTASIGAFVGNMTGLVSGLVSAGARDILFMTIPDLGLTPAVRAADLVVPGAAAMASGLSDMVNAAVLGALGSIGSIPGVDLDVLDLAAVLRSFVGDPAAVGLDDVASACAMDLACIADPSSTLFWDGVHPTTAGHALFAQAALAAVAVPEPATLVLVLAAFAALAWARRARREPARIGHRQAAR